MDPLPAASDEIRFEYCLESHERPQYIRSTQGHGVARSDPKFFTLLEIPCAWKVRTSTRQDFRTGQSSKEDASLEALVIAGDPLAEPLPDFKELPKDEPGMAHYKHPKKPEHDAVHTFDLKIAQDQGLTIIELAFLTPCHHKRRSETEIIFDTISAKVTSITRLRG